MKSVKTFCAAALLSLIAVLPVSAQQKFAAVPIAPEGREYIPLSSLDIAKSTCGWGKIKANKSINGNALTLRGTSYVSGVGTHANSTIIVKLNGSVTRFFAKVGIDDEVIQEAAADNISGRAHYRVSLKGQDGRVAVVAEGDISAFDKDAADIDIDVNGWKYLYLEATTGNGSDKCDHVDWVNAYLEFQEQNSTRPAVVAAEEISNKLDCPTMLFSQPGVRFMQKVKTASPLATIEITGLPKGLQWNAERKLISGTLDKPSTYIYNARVSLDGESSDETFTLTVADDLLLPRPAMAWISWNAVQSDISDGIVRQVTDFFEKENLIDLGWNTVVMDDWWHARTRAEDGKPQPDATRFPNGMKALSDYTHSKNVRLGIYTDMGNLTCAGAFGSFGYEKTDAETYAAWGIDFVKNDYCNAPSDEQTCRERYKTFGDALKACGRPVIFDVCEWGVREPWKWGAEVGGNQWRCTQDRRDCWIGVGSGVGIVQAIDVMKNISHWQGVNRWNDADMITLGIHGTGKSSNDLCKTGPGMTMDEYRSEFALYCMWASPLQLTFDPRANSLTKEDLDIIKNEEMIAINQDFMGQQADYVPLPDSVMVLVKDLENGDIALSVTNLDAKQKDVVVDFENIAAINGSTEYVCRDIWSKKYNDNVKGSLQTNVRPHATQVYRLSPQQNTGKPFNEKNFLNGRVSLKGSKVNISVPSTKNLTKRVIISDRYGHVLATTSTAKEKCVLKIPATKSPIFVNVICNALSHTWKVEE